MGKLLVALNFYYHLRLPWQDRPNDFTDLVQHTGQTFPTPDVREGCLKIECVLLLLTKVKTIFIVVVNDHKYNG